MPTKYVIVIPDGAADEPQESLGGKIAAPGGTHAWDGRALLARESWADPGTCRTGSYPRRDVATLSLLGYDPETILHRPRPARSGRDGDRAGAGRLGDPLQPDVHGDGRLTDFTAGHITSEEGGRSSRLFEAKLGTAAKSSSIPASVIAT